MKHLIYGAVLGVLWLVCGTTVPPVTQVLVAVIQPVIVAAVAAVAVRSYGRRTRGWTA